MLVSDQYKKYREQSVSTYTPGELIVLLYEQAAFNINRAIASIHNSKISDAHNSIVKAQNIFLYLMDSLDMAYPISQDLLSYYEYLCSMLVKANLEKSAEILTQILHSTLELKSTWQKVEINSRASKQPLESSI